MPLQPDRKRGRLPKDHPSPPLAVRSARSGALSGRLALAVCGAPALQGRDLRERLAPVTRTAASELPGSAGVRLVRHPCAAFAPDAVSDDGHASRLERAAFPWRLSPRAVDVGAATVHMGSRSRREDLIRQNHCPIWPPSHIESMHEAGSAVEDALKRRPFPPDT